MTVRIAQQVLYSVEFSQNCQPRWNIVTIEIQMDDQSLKQQALYYHEFPTPGKISVTPSKQLVNQHDLALAYSPGVAAPCLEIEKDPSKAALYTARGNLVAVITNGTAVLGLGNIGPLASRAVALMFGPVFISKYVTKENLHYLMIFQGFSIILWGFVQNDFYISLIALFIVGLSTTTLWSFTYALLQNNCDEKYIGRVISYNDMFFMLSCVLTTLFIGLMASLTSVDIITILLGVCFFAFAFYYTRILKWI